MNPEGRPDFTEVSANLEAGLRGRTLVPFLKLNCMDVSEGIPFAVLKSTGAKVEAWCILIHADASLSFDIPTDVSLNLATSHIQCITSRWNAQVEEEERMRRFRVYVKATGCVLTLRQK